MEQQKPSQPLSTVKSALLKKIEEAMQSRNSLGNKHCTQDLVPIDDIINGMIFTTDGRIINMLEILPINYAERTDAAKDMIADNFGLNFKRLPKDGHFKIMNSQTDLTVFEKKIRRAMRNETNPQLLARVDDYIAHTKKEQQINSVCKRFFLIYEYQADENNKKTDVYEDIYFTMVQQQNNAIMALQSCGNMVIDMQGDSTAVAEVLYAHFNPKTSKTESLEYRIDKLNTVIDYCKQEQGKTVIAECKDFFSPRGLRMGKWGHMVMDGVYHTYCTLQDVGYPKENYAGWLEKIIKAIPTGDLDIYYRQLPKEINTYLLDRTDVITRGVLFNRRGSGDTDNLEKLEGSAANAKYLKDCITQYNEDLYDVCIVVTLRANSYKEMIFMKNSFIKEMKTSDYHFDNSFLNTQHYFKMTMPLTYIEPEIFDVNKRNMTNSSLATLYCFTSYEMFTDDCYCMGTLYKNGTLFGFNNFSKMFANPHIFIAGTTGAGKTFIEDMITSRMRMKNMRVMYILPLKGHEYADNVNSLGGTYIPLRPGGEICVNICEIRPRSSGNFDSLKDDSELYKEMQHEPSLLAQKITSLINWVRMNMGDDKLTVDEASELNVEFTKVYNSFGITEDNSSIWLDKQNGTLKPMPIIENLYNGIIDNPMLQRIVSVLKKWVFGNCKNMNGQTNVDLSNYTLAFDVNEDIIGEELLPAFMYIAFEICYGIAQADLSERCTIALDEVWKFLTIPACAQHIYKMIKILRAYNTCVISATQDIEDCANNPYGKALLTLSAIKIFLKVNQDEIAALGDSMDLSPENKELIQSIPVGYGFVCFNTDRVLVNFSASLWEQELYNTDPVKKAEIRQQRLLATS